VKRVAILAGNRVPRCFAVTELLIAQRAFDSSGEQVTHPDDDSEQENGKD